jgi:hypothetical protein
MALASAVLAWTDRLPVAAGVLPVPLRKVALTAREGVTRPARLRVSAAVGPAPAGAVAGA